jgi:hypothetical protein
MLSTTCSPSKFQVLYTSGSMQIDWLSCVVGGAIFLSLSAAGALCTVLWRQKWQMVVFATTMTLLYSRIALLIVEPLTLESQDIVLANGGSAIYFGYACDIYTCHYLEYRASDERSRVCYSYTRRRSGCPGGGPRSHCRSR